MTTSSQTITARLPAIGTVVLGRFRIDGELARGGFGAIYRARRLDVGDDVALKILLGGSGGEIDVKRFLREAELVQKLRHPNVVRMLDFGQTERGTPYIAFELLSGRSLDVVLAAEGALAAWRTLEIVRDLLRGLGAAHERGIVHRDIKPQNVFLCDVHGRDRTKLLDFGVAKSLGPESRQHTALTEVGQLVGTPFYMAPEQVRGEGVTPATDVYAVGLLVCEMLHGRRIVDGEGLLEVYLQHVRDEPHALPPAVLRSPISAVVERAIAKPAAARYPTAREMLRALEAALREMDTGPPSAALTHVEVDDGDVQALAAVLPGRGQHVVPPPTPAAKPSDPLGATHALLDTSEILATHEIPGGAPAPSPFGAVSKTLVLDESELTDTSQAIDRALVERHGASVAVRAAGGPPAPVPPVHERGLAAEPPSFAPGSEPYRPPMRGERFAVIVFVVVALLAAGMAALAGC
jgi:serine/threonine protein kinase